MREKEERNRWWRDMGRGETKEGINKERKVRKEEYVA